MCYTQRFPRGNFIILLLYVDDMLTMGHDVNMIQKLERELSNMFDKKDLGNAKHILGMEIMRDRNADKLWLSQERFIERMLERFKYEIQKASLYTTF